MSAPTADVTSGDHRRGLESLLSFWADAGVEVLYGDAPVDRTVRPTVKASVPAQAIYAPQAALPSPAPSNTGEARRLADAATDLDALRAAAVDYLRRTLGVEAKIFWRGVADASVVVIGEAPGLDDEAAGQPFAGPPGRLLDRMLAAAGLTERALMIHTVFWRPPGDRSPSAEEQAICAPFVERAIALTAPKALLLVGAGVAKAMLGRAEPILSLHGRWLEWRSADGGLELPALPTLNPAFLLRQPMAKAKSWADLLTLSERVDRSPRPD